MKDDLQRQVGAVVSAVDRACLVGRRAADDDLPPQSATVTVQGDRGSGKSTVLWRSFRQLQADARYLVLDVIRPETMPPGDSLEGRVIEGLYHWLNACRADLLRSHPEPGEQSLEAQLEDLALREAGSRLLPTQLVGGARVERGAALGATRDGFAADRGLRSLVEKILTQTGKQQMIVVIDDPDAAPSHVPSIIGGIRNLDELPSITCVVALDLADFKRHLASALSNEYGLAIDDPAVLRGADRQVEKAFPPWNRVRLYPWTPAQRLNFTSLFEGSQQGALRTMLESIPIVDGEMSGRLLDAIQPSGMDERQGHLGALPDRPRALESLYRELAACEPEDGLFILASYAVEQLGDASAQLSIDPPTLVRDERGRPHLSIDTSRWKYYFSNRSTVTFGVDGSRTRPSITLKVGVGVEQGARLGPIDDGPRLPGDLVSCALFLTDCLADERFEQGKVRGILGTSGGNNFRRVDVTIDGSETDRLDFTVPRWPSTLDVGQMDSFLQEICDTLVEDARQEDTIRQIEWFVLSFLRAIPSVQTHRMHDRGSGVRVLSAAGYATLPQTDSEWSQLRRRLAQTVARSNGEIYRQIEQMSKLGPRELAFRNWYEGSMLGAVHPALVGDDLAEIFRKRWESDVEAAGRQRPAREALRKQIELRLSARQTGSWRDHLTSLGRVLDLGPEFERRVLEIEVERDRYQAEARRIGALVHEDGLPTDDADDGGALDERTSEGHAIPSSVQEDSALLGRQRSRAAIARALEALGSDPPDSPVSAAVGVSGYFRSIVADFAKGNRESGVGAGLLDEQSSEPRRS